VGRRVDRLEARAAQPVDRESGDLDRQARQQERHPGHVPVILAGLVGAAEDDVLDDRGVDLRPLDDRPDDERRQVVRPDARQHATIPPERRPDRIDDPGLPKGSTEVTHRDSLSRHPRSSATHRWNGALEPRRLGRPSIGFRATPVADT
jgi:hypothetical protein